MNFHTADMQSDAVAAGDKRKRGLDQPSEPIKKEQKTSAAEAEVEIQQNKAAASMALLLARMRAAEEQRPRAFSLLHLAEAVGLPAADPAHLLCFFSIDRKHRSYLRVTSEQLDELRTLASAQGIAEYERVDMRADCGIDLAAPINKVEADIERGPMLLRRKDDNTGSSTPAAAAAASPASAATAAASSSESSVSPSALFLFTHGVLIPISLVQGLIWYRNPTGPQNWDPELRFVQDCERTPAQIEAHAPEQNFAHRLEQAIPGHSVYAHHMRSAVLDLRFACTSAGNAEGSVSSVSSSSSGAASFTKQQRDAVSAYLASHLPASFSILKLNVTIAQLKSMEREADEEAPRVPTQVAPSYGVCEHHRSKQPVPFIQVKSGEEGYTPLAPSSHSSSSSSEAGAVSGFARTPPLGQSAGAATVISPSVSGVAPLRVTPMMPSIMHPMAVGHPGMQMIGHPSGPMGPQQQQAQAYAMMQQQQAQQQQAQGQLGMTQPMHLGMNPTQMHPSHMPPGSVHALQAQLMAQAQLNMHHQASIHSAQSAAAAHLHHQQQQQQAAAFAAANHSQMMSSHPAAGMPPHMMPHPMQMQPMHMPFPVRHMMQQQQTPQMQPLQQTLQQPLQPAQVLQQMASPTLVPSQPTMQQPMMQQLQPPTLAPIVSRPMPSASPPAKSVASAKTVVAPAEPPSPDSPVHAPRASASAAAAAASHPPASPPSSVSALAPPLPALRNGLTLTERTVYAGRLMACQGCHAVKSSCDAERPCFRCVRMGRQCIQREKARQRKTSKPSRPRPSNTAESRQIFAEHRAAAALLMANSNGADGPVVSDESERDSEAE